MQRDTEDVGRPPGELGGDAEHKCGRAAVALDDVPVAVALIRARSSRPGTEGWSATAKTNLSRIIERVEHGEEIIISRAGRPVAKVVPLTRRVNRAGRGSLRGKLVIAADWDSDQVNDAIASDFGMTP
jgi:prevent-host-death family protein